MINYFAQDNLYIEYHHMMREAAMKNRTFRTVREQAYNFQLISFY